MPESVEEYLIVSEEMNCENCVTIAFCLEEIPKSGYIEFFENLHTT